MKNAQFFQRTMIKAADILQWHGDLPPGHERKNGTICIGGVAVSELARTYGTPLLVLDGGVLDASIGEFVRAANPWEIEIAYAGKALLTTGLARILRDTPLALDVCSLGELATAERAAWPAERIRLHGCGKSSEELRAAVAGRTGRIIVDNLDELRELAQHAQDSAPVRLLLRINTGVAAHTHAHVQTGGDETKFGITAAEFGAAASLLRAHRDTLAFQGLHSHIGSQIHDVQAFTLNAKVLMEAAAYFAAQSLPVRELIAGGGFGVESTAAQPPLDLTQVVESVARCVAEQAAALSLPLPRIGIEPGRALVARAGTSLYRVMARKEHAARTFVIADGSIADNPRPALYGAHHHAYLASRTSAAPVEDTIVCGRSCENDRLTEALLPTDLAPGDVLAFCTTGAYTYSMASNYNRFAKPAVVYVKDGNHTIMARRETIEDVLRNDA